MLLTALIATGGVTWCAPSHPPAKSRPSIYFIKYKVGGGVDVAWWNDDAWWHDGKSSVRQLLPSLDCTHSWVSPSFNSAIFIKQKAYRGKTSNILFVTSVSLAKRRVVRVAQCSSSAELISWSRDGRYALFNDLDSLYEGYFVVDTVAGKPLWVRTGAVETLLILWSLRGDQLVLVGATNGHRRFYRVELPKRGRRSVCRMVPLTDAGTDALLGNALRPAADRVIYDSGMSTDAGLSTSIAVSPSGKVFAFGRYFHKRMPDWAPPDVLQYYFFDGRALRVHSMENPFDTPASQAPIWSRDEKFVYLLTGEYLFSISYPGGVTHRYPLSGDLEGTFQIAITRPTATVTPPVHPPRINRR